MSAGEHNGSGHSARLSLTPHYVTEYITIYAGIALLSMARMNALILWYFRVISIIHPTSSEQVSAFMREYNTYILDKSRYDGVERIKYPNFLVMKTLPENPTLHSWDR